MQKSITVKQAKDIIYHCMFRDHNITDEGDYPAYWSYSVENLATDELEDEILDKHHPMFDNMQQSVIHKACCELEKDGLIENRGCNINYEHGLDESKYISKIHTWVGLTPHEIVERKNKIRPISESQLIAWFISS